MGHGHRSRTPHIRSGPRLGPSGPLGVDAVSSLDRSRELCEEGGTARSLTLCEGVVYEGDRVKRSKEWPSDLPPPPPLLARSKSVVAPAHDPKRLTPSEGVRLTRPSHEP